MAQSSQHYCTNCSAPLAPGQRFCSNCGATQEVGAGSSTAMASGSNLGYGPAAVPIDAEPIPFAVPPPPPPPSSEAYNPPPTTYYPPQPPAPVQQQAQQNAPTYARPQKNSSRGVLGQIGCGLLAIILVVLLICAGAGYFVYHAITGAVSNANATATVTSHRNTPASDNTSQSGGVPKTFGTANINQTITYADVDTTLVSVQEASSFADDPNTNAPVLLRINIKEHNISSNTSFLSYNANYLLVLPDKTTVAVSNSQVGGVIDQAVQRNNWLDFPLTKSIPINQLTLQIGAPTEAQMSVPLTGSANLSGYQTKTVSQNQTFMYIGLKWTLTQVTSSLSHKAVQAKAGMRYITLAFTLDNSSSNTVFTSTPQNARLQQGSTTNNETDDTLPTALAPGTTGGMGTVTFEMLQTGNSFTLIMLAQPNNNPPVSQQTVSFQI